jgi:hypothetical protein
MDGVSCSRGDWNIQTTGDHASILTDEWNRAGLALHLNGVLDRGNYSLVAAGEPGHAWAVQLTSNI